MSTSDAKEVKGDSKQAEAKAADGQKEQEDFIILSLRSDVPPAQAVVRTPKKTTLGEFKAAASKHLVCALVVEARILRSDQLLRRTGRFGVGGRSRLQPRQLYVSAVQQLLLILLLLFVLQMGVTRLL